MYLPIFSKVSVLLVIFAIGALARFRNILTEGSIQDMCKLVLYVTLPFLYFNTLAVRCTPEAIKSIWNLPLFAMLFVIIAYAIGRAISGFLPLSREAKGTFVYLVTFTNCGFLAIPIASMLYGDEGVMMAVLFNIGFNILYWTIGVATLRHASGAVDDMTKNLLNSGTIGLIAGLAAGVFAVRLPGFLLDTTKLIGSATIPLALLVIGAIMAGYDLKPPAGYKRSILLIVAARLVVIPLIAVFVTKSLTFLPALSREIIVLQCAMPSASTTPIFVKRFGGDIRLAGLGVFATTLASVFTIPLIMALL